MVSKGAWEELGTGRAEEREAGVHPNDSAILNRNGLNLQAVFYFSDLPAHLRTAIEAGYDTSTYRQLLFFGHGGQRFWQALNGSSQLSDAHPVDCFTLELVRRFFAEENPTASYSLLYPGQADALPLQQLGRLAGWHHDSPFWIGVNALWGSWFAYRAVLLADTSFAPTLPVSGSSPCDCCEAKPCLSACPVVSVAAGITSDACMAHRLEDDSNCACTCLARLACPVGTEHRYTDDQMAYHYGRSLQTICSIAKDGR